MNEYIMDNVVHAMRKDSTNIEQWEEKMNAHYKAHMNEDSDHMKNQDHHMNFE